MDDLIAEIEANPSDDGLLQVYADRLQEQGSPLGELILLDERHGRRWRDLHDTHREEIYGPLYEHRADFRLSWAHGLIHTASVPASFTGGRLRAPVEALLAAPAARFLRAVDLLSPGSDDDSLEPALEALAAGTPRRAIHNVSLRTAEIGRVTPLFESLTHLEELEIRGRVKLGPIKAPCLKRFRYRQHRFESHPWQDIADAHWPSLESLTLHVPEWPQELSPRHLVSDIMQGCPSTLRSLQLLGFRYFGVVFEMVSAREDLCENLDTLTLSGELAPEDARRLIDFGADHLSHLTRLRVASLGNLDEELQMQVRSICRVVKTGVLPE